MYHARGSIPLSPLRTALVHNSEFDTPDKQALNLRKCTYEESCFCVVDQYFWISRVHGSGGKTLMAHKHDTGQIDAFKSTYGRYNIG